ncbi:hypothetical protein JMUB7547_28480 [Staphylococcus aureus]
MCIRDRKKLFFKQKTAYEMSASLVGSEMCIRDRHHVRVQPMPERHCRDRRSRLLSLIHI